MALTPTERATLLNNFATRALFFSLHTADPGTTGASEVSGGSYARVGLSWAAATVATPAVLVSSAGTTSNVPAATSISYGGYWTLASGGTFVGGYPLDTAQTYTTAGTYTVAAGGHTETLTG